MSAKQPVQLGTVEETMLVPLYARALETRKKRPLLKDPKALEIVDSIDWKFDLYAQRRRMFGCVLRTCLFDLLVQDFLRSHPEGTVVEIGAGLNTRFERLDNGRLHWFDLDLPDSMELRRRFFADAERRSTIARSVADPEWIPAVRHSPGPYCFAMETVLVYLGPSLVKKALSQIAACFPGARLILDTASHKAVARANKDHARRKLDARFAWPCDDPHEIEAWDIGLRLVESQGILELPEAVKQRLSAPRRAQLALCRRLVPQISRHYRLNVFEVKN